ncbi:MAG: ATP-dependent RNA helicase RhlB [Thermodesulfobacteriota bacterium]
MIKRLLQFFRGKRPTAQPQAEETNVVATSIETQEAAAEPGSRNKRRRRRKKKPMEEGVAQPAMAAEAPWNPEEFAVVPEEGKSRFHDLPLPAEVMHAIADLGFQYCTPIQAETLNHSLAGRDVIGQAQTGTGKTAAFLITLITAFLARPRGADHPAATPRALILAPTRELVIQIGKEAEALAKYSGLTVLSVFGGIDYQKQRQQITAGPVDIMVATPGRLIDFQRQKAVNLGKVEILVLDEADRMLDMGFIPDVRRIVLSTPPKEERQTLFFSATMTPEVNHLAAQWTKKPVHVEIAPEKVAVESVEQVVYLATAREKYDLLYNLITSQNLQRVMVFANRRDETRKLAERLKRNGINCAMLSGEVSQGQRIRTLEDFRNGKIRVLVATDVAGRGIHIDDVSHVVNYTLPYEAEDYVHRIGRTGRAGAKGVSISFACEEGAFYMPEIETLLGHKLECVHPPPELLIPAPRGTVEIGEQPRSGRPPRSGSPSGSGRPRGRRSGPPRSGSRSGARR